MCIEDKNKPIQFCECGRHVFLSENSNKVFDSKRRSKQYQQRSNSQSFVSSKKRFKDDNEMNPKYSSRVLSQPINISSTKSSPNSNAFNQVDEIEDSHVLALSYQHPRNQISSNEFRPKLVHSKSSPQFRLDQSLFVSKSAKEKVESNDDKIGNGDHYIENITANNNNNNNNNNIKQPIEENKNHTPLSLVTTDKQGNYVILEKKYICDACQFCDDTCAIDDCMSCKEKKERKRNVKNENEIDSCNKQGSFLSWFSLSSHQNVKNFTRCEIRRHTTLASCWLICGNNVYDATDYLFSHPGGIPAILRHSGGLDCTEDFNFHSKKGRKLWASKQIGNVIKCPSEQQSNSINNKQFESNSADCVVM